MKKFVYTILALTVVATLAWAATVRRETVRWDFINGIRAFSVTDLSGNTLMGAGANGETVMNGTDGTLTMTRNTSGTVTVTAADDDATAALTVLPGGAAAMGIGGASTTAVTVLTDSTGNGEVVLPAASVGAAEVGSGFLRVVYCGENDENGAVFVGPVPLTTVDPVLADATCDALDSATESTADAIVSVLYALTPKYMACIHDATLGSGETIVYQLRSAEASISGLACTSVEATTGCEIALPTASAVALNATSAVSITQTSNNADADESKCVVYYAVN